MATAEDLLQRVDALIDRIEGLLPTAPSLETDWTALAWRWKRNQHGGCLEPIREPHQISLADLHGIAQQKLSVIQNTEQFVLGYPANHVLLTGARGTGKSSLVKALLSAYATQGLRLIEVDKADLVDFLEVANKLHTRKERFIIYCDDLSFEANDPAYKALKVVLDGAVGVAAENVLVYATSNRRNLMPEYIVDNEPIVAEEVRPNDTVEEKNALAERFGLRVVFYPMNQEQYLNIAESWLRHFDMTAFDDAAKKAALQWSYGRGARSGRVAYQFAKGYAGQKKMANKKSEDSAS